MTEDTADLRETLKKRLELMIGLPLTPQSDKKIEQHFDDNFILVENFPLLSVETLRIDDTVLTKDDYVLNESEGCIYLTTNYEGFLYVEYTYGLKESEYGPLLDLMVEYESDNSWNKDASSVKENNVTVNYDTSIGKGARILGMIQDLKNKYSCVVEMI